jgi:hypothetical protein
MHRSVFKRATAGVLMAFLATTATAFAETVTGDADVITAGDQATFDRGTALPGADVHVDVGFRLDCTGTSHVDPGQAVRLSPGTRSIPSGGGFSVGSITLTPGADWPADGADCPIPAPSVSGVLHMVVTAPPDPATDLHYMFSWNRSLVPTTATDAGVLAGSNPSVTFILDVADNTPPTIHLPGDMSAEATSTAGADVTWSATATDTEDPSPPTPTCAPASGSTFPLGVTTVNCSVTDGGGLSDSGSFQVSVVDTTAPNLIGMPSDQNLTTSDPGGTTLKYAPPTATDIADSSPTVGCSPASGSHVDVGTTTVTCTAQDASGNHVSASFTVNVTFVPAVTWSAAWGEPVATSGGVFVANPGRTVPVKVELFADGVEQTHGNAVLAFATCAGEPVGSIALTWDGGRWVGHLDTNMLGGPGCYVATVSLDGNVAGSFRIDLRGTTAALASGKAKH